MKNKIAIVTGSSRGIGAAIAEKLAGLGVSVVVNYSGRAADADKVVENIKKAGGKAIAVQANVADVNDVKKLFDAAEKEFGGVDILVNNAGIMPGNLPTLTDTDDKTFDEIFAVNVKGVFNTLREAGKRLRDGGRIVNLSTSVIGMRREGYSVYSASKSAVETLSIVMSKELRGREITVNVVAPGPTATDLFKNGKSEELINQLAKMAPLERLGTPEDIAGAVAFLVGPDGGWINGQVLRANGGII